MPSNLPSSFASAAAGRDARGTGGSRGSGGGDSWSRQGGRSANGTLTFRRSSTTPLSAQQSQQSTDTQHSSIADILNNSVSAMPPSEGVRYSRDELLGVLKNDAGRLPPVSSLYTEGWNPGHTNGNSGRGWGKSNDNTVPQDPSVCWDASGQVQPMSLQEMSQEERELFDSDVNSPIKAPPQKDATQAGGINGRKTSISHGSSFVTSSPSTASRPSTRRRETTDTNPFSAGGLASPTGTGRFGQDSWFSRKTDTKDLTHEEPEEESAPNAAKTTGGFGSLVRSNTSGSSGFPMASLWGSQPPAAATGPGAFGSFALSGIGESRPANTGGRSRLAHLIPKDNEATPKSSEPSAADSKSWRSRPRTDTDPFGAEEVLSGSAALGGQDASPVPLSSGPHNSMAFNTPIKATTADFGMSNLSISEHTDDNLETNTNPYRSPANLGHDDDARDDPDKNQHGSMQDPSSAFGTFPRGFVPSALEGSDRSQTSSAGAKGFPPLNTFGGWPSAIGTGTPDRERSAYGSAFGGSIFSPIGGEIQSPGFGAMGGSILGQGPLTGSVRGPSKMGSLFPPAMQAQMQNQEAQHQGIGDSMQDNLRQANPLGAIGRGSMAPQSVGDRSRAAGFDDYMSPVSESVQPGGLASSSVMQAFQSAPTPSDTASGQVRSMVMPDRMRWVYKDPQGQMQGPFNGLEMNDWYKAQFFSADLLVKKIEDREYEPLGSLIRRIGNSREPFLVPQMGVAHGPAPVSGQFATGDRGIIPPLVGAFPSFGRTLTAEEQNNLERRKQEEQFMMARQREYMASQHHPFPKLAMGASAVPGALHHHSSAHSLQSQPSFGSISSPIGAPQQPIGAIAPGSTFFESGLSHPGLSADFGAQERQLLGNLSASANTSNNFPAQQPIGAPSSDSALRSNLPALEHLSDDSQGFRERLKQFNDLRAQRDTEDDSSGLVDASRGASPSDLLQAVAQAQAHAAVQAAQAAHVAEDAAAEMEDPTMDDAGQGLSLTQQVQKTQAAAAAAAKQRVQNDAVWAKPATDLPMPFPPAQSHIAAPTAQRTRSTLPEQYSRSQSETPDSSTAGTAPPPLAPWARDPGTESQKGPSLKEIQAAEAKKAARAEEVAAAARRAAAEHEAALLREREKAALGAPPGLPTTSTWGTASPVGGVSPWTKPGSTKPASGQPVSSPAVGNRRTLADIQREEEKQKLKALQATMQTTQTTGPSAGKRYADLASKVQAPTAGTAPPPGSGWATVGAGGKVKAPTGPAATRTPSMSTAKPVVSVASVVRPALKQSTSAVGNMDAAQEEFNKWLRRELNRGITGGIDIDGFASTLLVLPPEIDIISEAVYANSTTMDARHFAEEFIRRKRLADKGVIEKQPSASTSVTEAKGGAGGWSEVAKKGGNVPKEEPAPTGFKVVPGRKKGKK